MINLRLIFVSLTFFGALGASDAFKRNDRHAIGSPSIVPVRAFHGRQGGFFQPASFAKHSATSIATALIPRGGGVGLMSAETAAKAFTVIMGLNSLHGVLMTGAHLKLYSLPVEPTLKYVIQDMTAQGVDLSTLFYLQLFQNMAFGKAIGYSVLPSTAVTLYKIVNGKHKDIGAPNATFSYLFLAANLSVLYASLTDAAFASFLFKCNALLLLSTGLAFRVIPEATSESFLQWSAPKTSAHRHVLVVLGCYWIAAALAVGLQVFELTDGLLPAIGWTITGMSAFLLSTILGGSFERTGLPLAPIGSWLILMAVMAASILL